VGPQKKKKKKNKKKNEGVSPWGGTHISPPALPWGGWKRMSRSERCGISSVIAEGRCGMEDISSWRFKGRGGGGGGGGEDLREVVMV